jgi:hypothetical protein
MVGAAVIAMTFGWACAGSESAPRATHASGGAAAPSLERNRTSEAEPHDEPRERDEHRSAGSPATSRRPGEFRVEGEVGGLDVEAVERIVQELDDDIERCWQRASNQHEWLAGVLAAVIQVDGGGRGTAHAERTTLGNRELERCVLDSFEKPRWPRPVGGKTGVVRRKLTFDLAAGVRAPGAWTSSRVADVVRANSAAITACKGGSRGRFLATAYLETVLMLPDAGGGVANDAGGADAAPVEIGRAMSVGIAPPDAAGETRVDCLVDVLQKATWPPPGAAPAKVTFDLMLP